MYPRVGKARTSPKAWMTRMLKAKAVARTPGIDTLANAVLDGPVLRKRKKTEMNIRTQAAGNGVNSITTNGGTARTIPTPETKKYEPGYLLRKRSPIEPPIKVESNPATTMTTPKMGVAVGGCPR